MGAIGSWDMEDGDDDVEYNYLADQEEVEKEEFRNDRAVKISSKDQSPCLTYSTHNMTKICSPKSLVVCTCAVILLY